MKPTVRRTLRSPLWGGSRPPNGARVANEMLTAPAPILPVGSTMNKLTRSSDVRRLTRSRPPNISLEPPAVSLRIAGINNDVEQFSAMPAFPFSELRVPTLVMHGTNDRNVPFETAEFAASNVPNSEFVEIEGGPHEFFLIRQRQDSFVGTIIPFLKNHQHRE
jgi:pimeloyl-ACP methyl ester carboxylesterase